MQRLALVVALLTATSSVAEPALQALPERKDIEFFRGGIPQDRVPGLALIKLRGVDAHQLLSSKQGENPLKGLSKRTNVSITFVRPVALGWALVEVRDPGVDVIPTEARTLELVLALATDPAVEKVSDDKWMRALATTNDPGLPQMWHFDIINAQEAWDIETGRSTQRVGIIDTGLVRAHEDVGNRAVGGFDFVSSTQASTDGNGRDSDFNDTGDDCGGGASFHGTHVAGTIGATANNGTGVVGLNFNAGLVIGRALGACGGDLVDIGEAAVWLAGGQVDNVPSVGANKVSVMNLSLGSDSQCSSFEQDVVNFVNNQGSIFVAAAGNSSGGGSIAPVGSPANCSGVVSVAAHGPDRSRASYSSFGNEVEIVAPGGDFAFGQEGGVLSSIGPNSDFYTFQQGTSMAAPHVTGSISLMQARNASLTRQQIVQLMTDNGTSCTGCSGKPALVLDATLAAITPNGDPPPPPPPGPTDDPLEENDSFDQAKVGIGCGQSRNDMVALPADQDWFVVTTTAGQDVDINISAANGADLDLYVLSGPTENDIVGASESATGDERVQFTSPGGVLHVLVNPFVDPNSGTQNTGPYSISIACDGEPVAPPPQDPPENPEEPTEPTEPVGPDPDAIEDELEDNDDPASAAEVFCEEERTLTAKDDDFFYVDVREGDALGAIIEDNGLDLKLAILDESGEEVVAQSKNGVATSEPLAAGTYLIRVRPSGELGTYRLTTHCGEIATDGPNVRGGCSSTGGAAFPAVLLLLALVGRRQKAAGSRQ